MIGKDVRNLLETNVTFIGDIVYTRNVGFRIAFPVGPNWLDVSFTLAWWWGTNSFARKLCFRRWTTWIFPTSVNWFVSSLLSDGDRAVILQL